MMTNMLSTLRLVLALTILNAGAITAAESLPAPAPAVMDSIRFFGRWDLRTPNHSITVNSGSYLVARFSGPAITARFDISLNNGPFPTVTWRIDNGEWQESEVWTQRKLAEGLAAGPHTLCLMVRGIDEHQSRWKAPLVGSVHFLGLEFPNGGKLLPPLAEWEHPKLKMEFFGDSITEGVVVQELRDGKTTWSWLSDALDSYPSRTALQLGAAWRQVGFGAAGLAHKGSGGALGALDTFNFFYEGCPRDDWQPDVVVINHGTNDATMPSEKYRPLYAQYLALIRQGYPHAKIVALRPFNGAQAEGIKQEVELARAAGDNAVYYIDTTDWYSGPLHPNAKACVEIANKLVDALKTQVIAPGLKAP